MGKAAHARRGQEGKARQAALDGQRRRAGRERRVGQAEANSTRDRLAVAISQYVIRLQFFNWQLGSGWEHYMGSEMLETSQAMRQPCNVQYVCVLCEYERCWIGKPVRWVKGERLWQ